MPVVPTRLALGRVMILGAYPTCRFATIGSERYVPVKDIDEPFENSRYFDNHSVRDVRSGDVLYQGYFRPLGLDPDKDLWITNLVKCFLLKSGHVNAYRRLGWTKPHVQASRDDYFKAASVCLRRNLKTEIKLCQPKLIITMGWEVCRVIHGGENAPSPEGWFDQLVGQSLRAGLSEHPLDTRIELFKELNVFHMFHPGYVMRIDEHHELEQFKLHLTNCRKFLVELGLADPSLNDEPLDIDDMFVLKPYIEEDHDMDMK